MALVAGIDSSTQSTKVEVRDASSGHLVASGSAPHPPVQPPRSEQDPHAWWSAVEQAWAAAGDPQVAAISVGAQQHGMVALDAGRDVIRPAKLWNDTESAADAGWLHGQLDDGAAGWAAAVGSVPLAAFTVTKLSWLHRSEPEHWARLAHVVLPHDWLTFRLTGQLVTDRGDASGTGYWSAATGEYRWDLLAIVDDERDWTDAVPRVLGPLDVAGTASAFGEAVVAPGTGDNMAAALGLALAPGELAMSVGTSGTVYAVTDVPTSDPSGAVAGFADATGRFLPLACTLNAAKVLDAVARLLGADHAEFDELALDTSSDGLTLLPYFDGERTPDRPNATGWMSGMRSDVTRGQLARAAVEGVACGLLDALDAVVAQAPASGRLVLTGGGARSEAVRRTIATLAGDRPVVWSTAAEAVATGACVQAAAVLGGHDPVEVARGWGLDQLTEPVEPLGGLDATAVRERYAELRDRAEPG